MSVIIPPLRTKRLAVRLREMSIGDSIGLCGVPPLKYEAANTEFFNCALIEASLPSKLHSADPRAWTVQERLFVITHYMACVNGGSINLGEGVTLDDYFISNADYPMEWAAVGSINGVNHRIKHLTGAEVEAAETLLWLLPERKRFHWLLAGMACQLVPDGETDRPHPIEQHAGYADWLRVRVTALERLPESEFAEMLKAYGRGQAMLTHFFNINFDQHGIVVMPNANAGAEVAPVRFPASACASAFAAELHGKSDQRSR